MKRIVTYCLLSLAAVSVATEASAQKYPERRTAREATKLYWQDDFTGAETEYRRALEINPDLKEAYNNLGNALFRQEKFEEAIKIYMDAASDSTLMPIRLSEANFNAGNTMLAGRQIEQAIEFYKQALRLNPDDMQAKYNLAYAKLLLQQQPPDENKDQNKDQDQDQNEDQNKDQDKDQDQNQDQDGDQDQNNDQDRNDDRGDDQDGGDKPQPDQGGQNEVSISPEDAGHMLEAIQDAEDNTREKMNAKEVPAVGRSGKNW